LWLCTPPATPKMTLRLLKMVNHVVLISVGDVHNSVWKSVWFPRGELSILNLTPYARHFKLLGTRFELKQLLKIWHSAALMLTLLHAPRINSLLFKILLFYASITINDLLVWLLNTLTLISNALWIHLAISRRNIIRLLRNSPVIQIKVFYVILCVFKKHTHTHITLFLKFTKLRP